MLCHSFGLSGGGLGEAAAPKPGGSVLGGGSPQAGESWVREPPKNKAGGLGGGSSPRRSVASCSIIVLALRCQAPDSLLRLPRESMHEVTTISGYLKAVWLEIFGPVFLGFSAETDPRQFPRKISPADQF